MLIDRLTVGIESAWVTLCGTFLHTLRDFGDSMKTQTHVVVTAREECRAKDAPHRAGAGRVMGRRPGRSAVVGLVAMMSFLLVSVPLQANATESPVGLGTCSSHGRCLRG
jgi:hypothetical protein